MIFRYECIVMDLHQIIVKWIYTSFKLRIGIHVDYVGLIWIFSDTIRYVRYGFTVFTDLYDEFVVSKILF